MGSHQLPSNQAQAAAVSIRLADTQDFEQIWPFFKAIVHAGETYAFPSDCSFEEGLRLWMLVPQVCYVALINNVIVGSYYLKANMAGPGAHVCNCGYMVSGLARGQGVASLMCEHSQQMAMKLGYKAMQFNSVVSSNKGAVRLWQRLGFDIVGCLPNAFNHPRHGYVDSFVMYKWLSHEGKQM